MSKKNKSKDVPIQTQEDEARETILGLHRPKPFAELTDPEKIMVLCVQLKQLRNQFHNLRNQHYDLTQQFTKHQHIDGKVGLTLDDIHRNSHMVEAGASEFDPLR